MKKKPGKSLFAFALALVMLFSSAVHASASTIDDNSKDVKYVEFHNQINFTDFSLTSNDGKTIQIKTDSNISVANAAETKEKVDELFQLFEIFPNAEAYLASTCASGTEYVAISYTIAPLIWNEDHYDRVTASTYDEYEDSDGHEKGQFGLTTYVSKGSKLSNGSYTYNTATQGLWSSSVLGFIGGENYPAAGEDYILQSTPNTWTRTSDSISVLYGSDFTPGVSGTHFWAENGGTNYIRYAVKDDILGPDQASFITLESASQGPSSTSSRMINSYYVHTWKSMSLKVSVQASTNKSVSLSLTPSIEESSWQLYDYVAFEF